MTSYLKEKNKINCNLACILTDFEPHDQWLVGKDYVDYFFVAHTQMKYNLIDRDIEESKVFDTGIPISSNFLKTYNKQEVCKKLELNPSKKTILFFRRWRIWTWKRKNITSFKVTFEKYKWISNSCSFR